MMMMVIVMLIKAVYDHDCSGDRHIRITNTTVTKVAANVIDTDDEHGTLRMTRMLTMK